MALKAIETRYKGYRMRSRLEARWAVFFDALGIDYVYEPEGYDLDGLWYLPDFWLPRYGIFFEVKNPMLSQNEWSEVKEKCHRLSKASGKTVIQFGDCVPWNPRGPEFKTGFYYRANGEFDGLLAWNHCSYCGHIGMGHAGYHDELESFFPCGWDARGCGTNPKDDTAPGIQMAFREAMSARFEHGERGY